MRAITAAEDALLTSVGGRCDFLRVDVKDSGGTFRDLTTYAGENLVLSAMWGESVDQPSLNGSVVLKREVELLSLSPLMDTSALNLAFNPSGTPAPLVFPKREIKIYTATLPDGQQPTAGDWRLAMHGQIDEMDFGQPDTITLKISDFLQAQLRDLVIERERIYAWADPADSDATKGCLIFELNRAYVLNELVGPTEAKRGGFFYKVTIAGTSSATVEPTWPTIVGNTVTSGTVQFTCMGTTTTTTGTAVEKVLDQLSADNGSSVTVTTPSAPGWLIKWYLQQRGGMTWEAMRALADQIGWDLRPMYDAGTASFKLKFLTIDRAKVAIDRTFSKSEVLKVNKLSINIADIRNVVRIVYSDSAVLDSNKNPVRTSIEVSDAGSITLFGRRFMEIQESSASNIDTSSEATTMANAALKDLATPNAEQEALLEYSFFVELGDLYRFSGDDLHHSGNLDIAVVGYQHSFDKSGKSETTITCRGKPSGGVERWLARATEINTQDTHQLGLANVNGLTFNSGKIIGGGRLKNPALTHFAKHALPVGIDFHVSATPSFTPDANTIIESGFQQTSHYAEGYGGQTYYTQQVPWGWNGQKKVLGLPSFENSFVAGFVEPHHINPEAFRMELPPNGSFEGQFRAGPPDRWEMVTGTWGTDVDSGAAKGVGAADGTRYLLFTSTSVATKIRTDFFPVARTHLYEVCFQVYRVSGDNDFAVEVEYYDRSKSSVSTETFTVDLGNLTSSAWNLLRKVFTVPSTASFARFVIKKSTAHTDVAYFDACQMHDLGEPWITIGNGSMSNSWVTDTAPNPDPTVQYRYALGLLEMRGAIKDGTIGATALTLPFAPPQLMRWRLVSGFDTGGELQVDTSGNVIPATGNNSWVSLDVIRFRVF